MEIIIIDLDIRYGNIFSSLIYLELSPIPFQETLLPLLPLLSFVIFRAKYNGNRVSRLKNYWSWNFIEERKCVESVKYESIEE